MIRRFLVPFCLAIIIGATSLPVHAQDAAPAIASDNAYSPGKAFGLSFLLPGLGHRYVNDGNWSGWATTYASADVALWLSLIGGEWRRNDLVESYTTLARGSASAQVDGKDRTFFLNLASFESSDQYRETMLRNRSWDLIGYVDDPSFQWEWDSEANYNRFRDMRDDAESLRRRRSILIASLVANRLISGAIAARSAGRASRVQISANLSAPIEKAPLVTLSARF